MTKNSKHIESVGERMRRKDFLILRLADANKRLQKRILVLEKRIQRIKQPPIYKKVWAFIKQLLRIK